MALIVQIWVILKISVPLVLRLSKSIRWLSLFDCGTTDFTTFTPKVKRVYVDEQQQSKKALNLLKEKRSDEAITQFTTIIQAHPTSKKANLGAAIAHFR